MKTIGCLVAVLLACLTAPTPLSAQWEQTDGPFSLAVSGITSQGAVLFLSAERNIYKSTDTGESWRSVFGYSPRMSYGRVVATDSVLYALYSGYSDDTGGFDGIVRSTDNGNTWTKVLAFASFMGIPCPDLYSLTATDSCVMIGKSNGLGLSTDYGKSWRSVDRLYGRRLVAFCNGNLFACDDSLLRSSDQGQTWEPAWAGLAHQMTTRLLAHGPYLFATTSDSGIFRSSNDGQSWSPVNNGLTDLSVTALISIEDTLVATAGGVVYVSSDEGESWIPSGSTVEAPGSHALTSLGSTIITATSNKGIQRSTDGGKNWLAGNSALPRPQVTAIAGEGPTLLAGTWDRGLFRSVDTGRTWTRAYDFACVDGIWIDGHSFYVSERWFGISRSSDNSLTWTRISDSLPLPRNSSLSIKAFAGLDSALFVGLQTFTYEQGGIYRSMDSGATWTLASTGLPSSTSIFALLSSGSVLCAAVDAGANWQGTGLYFSTDRGESWHLGSPGGVRGLGLVQAGAYCYAGTNKGLYRSSDHGISWNLFQGDLPASRSLGMLATDGTALFTCVGWISDSTSQMTYDLLCSTNGGSTWTSIGQGAPLRDALYGLTVVRPYLYVGTDASGVWRRPLKELMTSVHETRGDLPGGFALDQNYPNPFNPTTTIRYSLPHRSNVTLAVFNLLGQKVAELVHGDIEAGYHEVRFDAHNLASGVYFYRLQAGTFTQTRSLLLVR